MNPLKKNRYMKRNINAGIMRNKKIDVEFDKRQT